MIRYEDDLNNDEDYADYYDGFYVEVDVTSQFTINEEF